MQLRYDDDFVEAAVFLAASGRRPGVPGLQVRRFQSERERCYSVPDPDERNSAFFKVHLSWFREWGMEQLLTGVLKDYPLLPQALQVLGFRQARNKNEEGAEMYVSAGVRNALVALRMDRMERDVPLLRFLRHEFMHLHDMVDPGFAYSPHVHLPTHNQTQQRITRERYRLLWDITIDGRLTNQGRETVHCIEQHRALFDRAFSFWPDEKRRNGFESFWQDPAPNHARILALASDPRDIQHALSPLPGSTCPLCNFPTFEWADLATINPEIRRTVLTQFPHWEPEQGLCKRCAEIYQLSGQFEWPSTIPA